LQINLILHGMCTGNGDGSKGSNPPDGNKSNDYASQKSHRVNLDWREFRANLFAQEQVNFLYLLGCISVLF
jgi:hypothetical protein